jgi:hypothetical protein
MDGSAVSFYSDQSPFWRYFRDTLALSFLAVPGALAVLAHGLARHMDTVRRDIKWVGEQFVPPRAESDHIPLHGVSRGVPRTRFDKSDRYRVRVEQAASWHELGGKTEGLPQIIKEYGYADAVVYDVRQDDPARWATFDLLTVNPPSDFSQKDVEAAFTLAKQYKPARSVIRKIQFARHQKAPRSLGAALHCRIIIDHYARAQKTRPSAITLIRGAIARPIVKVEHYICAG